MLQRPLPHLKEKLEREISGKETFFSNQDFFLARTSSTGRTSLDQFQWIALSMTTEPGPLFFKNSLKPEPCHSQSVCPLSLFIIMLSSGYFTTYFRWVNSFIATCSQPLGKAVFGHDVRKVIQTHFLFAILKEFQWAVRSDRCTSTCRSIVLYNELLPSYLFLFALRRPADHDHRRWSFD